MAVSVPNALALTSIADGAAIVASDHRNNYSAVQVGVNGLIAMFTNAATKGDLIVSAGGGSFDKLGVGTNGQAIVADSTQTLGMKWATVASTSYRKTTSKTVNTTVAATDLLNGEITIAAGVLGTTGVARLTAWGDLKQNSGGSAAPPRLQVAFGGTTQLDTGATGGATLQDLATRIAWRAVVEIANLASASTQSIVLRFDMSTAGLSAQGGSLFTTGEGSYALGAFTGGTAGVGAATGYAAGAINTANASALVLNVINGSASASYETKLFGALVEIL